MSKKNILATGLVVASVMVAGVSVYAAGDVVEDTVDTVTERVGRGMREGRGERGQGGKSYEKAVEEGILTESEAQAIQEYREANRADMEAVREATQDMTREERQAYMEENYPKSEDPMQDLIDADLLTETQAEALEALRPDREAMEGQGGEKGRRNGIKGDMSSAVEAGILTQAEADAIVAYREANAPDKEAIDAETEGMTREERKAYMEENYPRPEDPMQDLIDADFLTEAQAEELEAHREEMKANRPEFDGEKPEGSEGQGQGGMRGGKGGMRGNGQRPGNEGSQATDTSL